MTDIEQSSLISYRLDELQDRLKAVLKGDPSHLISAVADLESATASHASFLSNARYEKLLQVTQAGVIVVSKDQPLVEGKNYLIVDEPSASFQVLIELFAQNKPKSTYFSGIHPTAVVDPSVKIGQGVVVGPYAVIEMGAVIGDRTVISAHVYIGPKTSIGADCLIYPHVTIREDCKLLDRVVIQSGAVIGSCGFGFTTDKMGRHTKLNQVGNVVIESDVEIGANTTIDRARFQSTIISEGTKIDNLVQIGHAVKVGKHNLIIAQTGIAGSTVTGKYVVLAGQVAVNGHITIGDQVMVAARSGVSKSLLKAGKYGGVPALPLHESNKISVYVQNIEKIVEEQKSLKKRIEHLETKSV